MADLLTAPRPHSACTDADADDDFLPTGLLGAGPSSSPMMLPAADADEDDDFVPSGLLADASRTLVDISQISLDDSHDFVPSGLLGSTQDELPSLSQLLPYPRDPAVVPADIPRAANVSPHLIRGSNYKGNAVYFGKKYKRTALQPPAHAASNMRNLLDVPYHRLLERVADATTKQRAAAAAGPGAASSSTEGTLWVDRYRPARFVDLLGDERVHRDTLAWVKEWDFCVFGKRRAKGKAPKRAWDDDAEKPAEGEYAKDEYQRPREKILLLAGPPGLGKTTLAHVVAKQAGYRVFEINASDARSGQVVEERIRPALESGARIGSSKPSLVIIDEIDGATGAGDSSSTFVQKLVELTLDPKKKKSRKRDGKPSKDRPLLRPIICICNDLYASALAKLRPHARIVRFNRPADIAVVKRLRTICEEQSLRADSRALTTLVGVTRGDLRGCLNTLQFIKAKNLEVTEAVIRSATAGLKEAEASATSVLNDLFAPMSRKRAKDLGLTEEQESRYVNRLGRDVEASGALDKIALGCFEHYTSLRRHDASFGAWHKAEEWLVTFDELMGSMRSNADYSLQQYAPYMLVPFYHLFQARGGPRVERPKADWENYMITRTNEEIYSSLSKCLRSASASRNGDYRHLAGQQVMQMEFAPLLNRIISPPLRPVNSQVIKTEERALLTRLVSIMVSLELRFVQDKTEEGQLVYRLDPPLDVFATYEGKRAADIAISRYATRHLVAGEIDAQLIVRHAEAIERHQSSKIAFEPSAPDQDELEEHDAEGREGVLMRADAVDDQPTSKRQRLDRVDYADRPPTDFFGRSIAVAPIKDKSKKTNKTAARKGPPGVTFRFNEGNSAAVRRNVKVSAFM